eukprot:IDg11610t1
MVISWVLNPADCLLVAAYELWLSYASFRIHQYRLSEYNHSQDMICHVMYYAMNFVEMGMDRDWAKVMPTSNAMSCQFKIEGVQLVECYCLVKPKWERTKAAESSNSWKNTTGTHS